MTHDFCMEYSKSLKYLKNPPVNQLSSCRFTPSRLSTIFLQLNHRGSFDVSTAEEFLINKVQIIRPIIVFDSASFMVITVGTMMGSTQWRNIPLKPFRFVTI